MLKYTSNRYRLYVLIEGILYFFFTQQMKDMMKLIEDLEVEKIKTIASIISIIGASLIYFTIRSYNIS